MKRVLVSRQPIFSAEMGEFGYELLYRSSDEDQAVFTDGNQATAEVILNTFEIGLEELVGKTLAFINFDRDLIIGDHCESLPRDRVVLGMVESVQPDAEMLARLEELKAIGYRIAIEYTSAGFLSMLEKAHFVRFDANGNNWEEIAGAIASMRRHPVQLIAKRVETREQFEQCKALGFDYFQGYFFCKPQLVEAKAVPVNRLAALRMIATLNDPQIKIHELEKAIGQDAHLTYKLLRYANSAMCGLARPVESIKHAVVLIGLEKIRIWASLLLLYGFEDKARDIITTGAVRARMCEQLAKAQGMHNPDKLFLVGLFSILDAIVDQPMAGALASLPLSSAVSDAILYQKGELGAVLKSVLAYERKDWVAARSGVQLSQEAIRQAYVDAVEWSIRTLNNVSHETEKPPPAPAKGTRRFG